MKTVNWALPLATLACYLLLMVWLAPLLLAQSAGGIPFDLRPMGYDLAAAQAYLATLTPVGAALYLGPIRLMDTVCPILLTLTLCLPLRGRSELWFLPALAFGLFDLAENVAVARLLQAGTDVQAQAVALASAFTQAKFAAGLVAIVPALFGLWQAWRNR